MEITAKLTAKLISTIDPLNKALIINKFKQQALNIIESLPQLLEDYNSSTNVFKNITHSTIHSDKEGHIYFSIAIVE